MEAIRKIFGCIIIYGIFLILVVLFMNKVLRLDEYLFFIINISTSPYLVMFFNAITYGGSTFFWALLIIFFWLKSKKKLSIQLLYAFIIDSVSLIVLKQTFLRSRPLENLLEFGMGPSFPSGHSQRVFSGAVILSSYYKKYRTPLYVLAFLVSLSRVYIGVHYPLDVLIGSINGIIVGIISLALPVKKKYVK